MTRKRILMLLGSVCLALMLALPMVASCAAPTPAPVPTPTPTPTPTEPIELSMATFLPETSSGSLVMKYFGDRVTERTDGQVVFKYHWAGTLGGSKEILPLVTSGAVDFGYVCVGYYPADFQLLTLTGLTLVGQHMETLQETVKQLFAEEAAFSKEFDDVGLRPLFTIPSDVTILGSTKKIESADDLKGLRLRTYGMITPVLEAWGAVPIALPSTDIYESVERGILDGFTAQSMCSAGAYGLQEVTPYFIDAGIGLYNVTFVPINKESFAGLPDEIQKIIEEVATEANGQSVFLYQEATRDELPGILEKAEVYRLSPTVKEELREIAWPAVEKAWIDQVVKGGVSESVAHALLARFVELCRAFDAETVSKSGFDIRDTEFP